jgi:hypothetical protein
LCFQLHFQFIFEISLLFVFSLYYDIWFDSFGNSPLSTHIFKLQKRVIWIIANVGSRESCRELFVKLKILPLCSQYIFSLISFVAKNNNLYLSNSEIHVINTRHTNFHYPSCNLTIFQRGAYCSGVKVFNKLPSNIQEQVHDINIFGLLLRDFCAYIHFIHWMYIIIMLPIKYD